VQSAADTGDPGVDGVAAIANLVQHLGVAGGRVISSRVPLGTFG
jgi:hypothetical protein